MSAPFLPVPVQPRRDGWTPARQWAFVRAIGAGASVAEAAGSVGMTKQSAYRLRLHPEAGDFRAAWEAAEAQVWGLIFSVAFDRVLNGEEETYTRGGETVTRRRPCSDRLLIHMLKERTARGAPNARATELALRGIKTATNAFPDRSGWDAEADDLSGAAPCLPQPPKTLAPRTADHRFKSRAARLHDGPEVPRRRTATARREQAVPAAADRQAEEAIAAQETARATEAAWAAYRDNEPKIRAWE